MTVSINISRPFPTTDNFSGISDKNTQAVGTKYVFTLIHSGAFLNHKVYSEFSQWPIVQVLLPKKMRGL